MIKNITLSNIHKIINAFGVKGGLTDVPIPVKVPDGQNILILEPHFDDAAIGCGGAIRKHVLAGNTVSVVCVTDGREGIPGLKDKKRVTEIRKEEGRKAMGILGVEDIYYLDEADTAKGLKENSIIALSKIILQIKPDLIYLPWFLDNHVDHVKTNELFRRIYKVCDQRVNVCAYEVWTPLLPNIAVDISGVIEVKRKALSCFESQLMQVDYLATTVALNKYRSCYLHGGRSFTEVFLHMQAKEYFSLF